MGRKFLSILAILIAAPFFFTGESNGQKVKLRSQITPVCTNTTSRLKFADIYADGNIAVQGSYNCRGAFIYNISNPDSPVLVSHYNPGANQQFLEAIVVGNRGYFGSGGGGGVHIVDLTNPASPVLLGIVNSTNGNAHNSIHEMNVLQQNGQTFLIENFNGFSSKIIKVINVTNPAAPVFVRDINPTEINWVHAMHIRGNRMFTSGWGNGTTRGRTEIYDISNIGTTAPALLGFIEDPSPIVTNGNAMHSNWTSEDGNFLYSCRETNNGSGDVRVYNITNPAVPVLVKSIGMVELGLNAVTPHNPVVMGNYLYVAWYQAGIQVFDISTPGNPVRVGQYDTYQPVFAPPAEELAKSASLEPWDMVCASDSLQNALPNTYDGNWAVYPFLGQNKVLAGDLTYGLIVLDASAVAAPLKNKVSDFDGDGKTDFSKYTPATGTWQIERSSNSANSSTNFGLPTDKLAAGDYDGDGKSDIGVWRPADGIWYSLNSSNGTFRATQFGSNGDIPVPGDFDADGRTDIAVWRQSTGVWYLFQSSLGIRIVGWGVNGDKPVVGDYEGDGKDDIAIYRNGVWWVLQSSSSIPLVAGFGVATDRPVAGDFEGDGKTDFAVYRPSTGVWYVLRSSNLSFYAIPFGISTDMPIPADYDGDAKTDLAVYRQSEGNWYIQKSSDNSYQTKLFGSGADIPSPTSAIPQ
jgi:hypothetical protein